MALEIGISFLVSIGYGGPSQGDGPSSNITCTHQYLWPPHGATSTTPRRRLLNVILTPAAQAIAENLLALAKRADDSQFIETIRKMPDEALKADGVCVEPAVISGDLLSESNEAVGVGDLAWIQLRGSPQALVKVFAGFIEQQGERKALFYLKTPEQVIEVDPADILYARRIVPPRETTGHDLLAEADPFVARLRAEHGIDGVLEPVGESRREAWLQSMLAILARLRAAPE